MIVSTFKKEDVEILLDDVRGSVDIVDITHPNKHSNLHYCDFIPTEDHLDKEYLDIFDRMLNITERQTAIYVGILTRKVCKQYDNLVFVSLLRAGTVLGVLMRRYAKEVMNKDIKHYSIGLSRGKGIDFKALSDIITANPEKTIVFIDGWVGKGTTKLELDRTCEKFSEKYKKDVKPIMAVLCDIKNICDFTATTEDILCPNCLINAQGCGLISRITQNEKIIHENTYNGAVIFKELQEEDKTYTLIDNISKYFGKEEKTIQKGISYKGEPIVLDDIIKRYQIQNINGIKVGLNETIRILLKRSVSFVLVKDINNPLLDPIKYLCHKRKVELKEDRNLFCESVAIILNHIGDE